MKLITSALDPTNPSALPLQVESSISRMGQSLLMADVDGLERHAHDLLKSLTALRSALSTAAPITSEKSAKVALEKCLIKMNLQLQQHRELLARRSSMIDLQLDTLLPPVPRQTYKVARIRSDERIGFKTFLRA